MKLDPSGEKLLDELIALTARVTEALTSNHPAVALTLLSQQTACLCEVQAKSSADAGFTAELGERLATVKQSLDLNRQLAQQGMAFANGHIHELYGAQGLTHSFQA
ncbi:hypothetical protein D2Q93_11515 [Alicyclobacillaceae bacterium I2511]|nr:hypothetical protein D2Q93_11515 [Alicyclobacillaceae bacterium I2511]